VKGTDLIPFNKIPNYSRKKFKLNMVKNALGDFWQVPVMVAKGGDGPVLGITAAIHGNELNGIPVIQQLWQEIDVETLKGTLVLVPVLNVPGFLNGTREYSDGTDLNRIMPGKRDGTSSQVYAYKVVTKLIRKFDYLIDIHTASVGRINSLYVRADMTNEIVAKMAELQEPEIIVNNSGENGTIRSEAQKKDIPCITIEMGDPHLFQKKHLRSSIFGLNNVMLDLGMIDGAREEIQRDAVVCRKSYWVYAQSSGILRVFPNLTNLIKKGDRIALICDVYGDVIEEILAPTDAIVVAKATDPVCQVGARVIHLGLIWDDYENLSN
jgi:uncharacterized protein